MRYLLSETLVTEIEARDEAELHGRRTASLVLSEAKRIAEQFVDALRSANARISKAAADAQVIHVDILQYCSSRAAAKCAYIPPSSNEAEGGKETDAPRRNDETSQTTTDITDVLLLVHYVEGD